MSQPQKYPSPAAWRLVPVVNLASLLVPTVLMAGWLTLTASSGEAVIATGASQLDLAVHLTPSGLEIAGDDETLTFAGYSLLLPCAASRCQQPTDYDLSGLQQRLALIKRTHPDQSDITLLPHPDTSYQQIVAVRHAVSQRRHKHGAVELFPWVVISESH